ncbi:sensor histidine kinase [Methanococcoides burtonii]|uniref:histidine kinase n=1 Tax=Methanococcoides burtonii (strain DSM 6242 / NBRC 107633 / OCM 468 / ACE-M) TaxID=259564 RepID=Q12WK7_METBU|nr:ATP-binding protein [Methanococcoides burtonii]ABE52169.1 Multisensor signal transduction histidine kinase [Methanococcoides burtonii DSM 6242]
MSPVTRSDTTIFDLELVQVNGNTIPIHMNTKAASIGGRSYQLVNFMFSDVSQNVTMNDNDPVGKLSRDQYSTIVEKSNDGVVLIYDLKVKFVNSKVLNITGYDRDEVMGSDFFKLISPGDRSTLMKLYQKILHKDKNVRDRYDTFLISKYGKNIPVEITVSFIEFNMVPAVMIIFRDISDKFKAKKAIGRKLNLEHTISSITSLFIAPDGIDVAINKALEKIGLLCECDRVGMFMLCQDGFVADNTNEWCGKGVLCHKEELQKIPVSIIPWIMEQLSKGQVVFVTDVGKLPSQASKEKDLFMKKGIRSFISFPIYIDSKFAGFICLYNVSDCEEWDENELTTMQMIMGIIGMAIERNLNEESLKTYAYQLAEANYQLESLDRMKDEFLANLSHELRTPLNVIKGFGGLMSEERFGKLDERQRKAMDAVMRNTTILIELVESLLYITSVQADMIKYSFAQINVESSLERAISLVASNIEKKRLMLKIDVKKDLPYIRGDKVYLEKVFVHLLGNAIKFTPASGTVSVFMDRTRDSLHIAIKDTGVGVASDQIPYMFHKFRQLDGSLTRKYGGVGIGLYICKHIVDAHKGKIWMESEEGTGTDIHIILPI